MGEPGGIQSPAGRAPVHAVGGPLPGGWKRWALLVLVALALGALAGSAAGPLLDARTASGAVYGPPPVVDQAEHVLGINADLLQLDAAGRQQFYAQAARLGLHWVRLAIPWREGPGVAPDWSRLDPIVDEANANQLRVLAVLKEVPAWTHDPGEEPRGTPPLDWRVFGPFAFQLASHFKGRIAAYQVWDEPNLSSGWLDHNPDAAAYTRLLREAAIQIRRADAAALIVSAALAPTTESGPLNLNEPEFLRLMYRAGAREFFDAQGAEPFGFWTGPDDRRADVATLNFSRLALLREVMQANGDGGKAIWATAFGWNAGGSPESSYGSDTANKQAGRTLDALRRARDEWPWLGPLMFARWRAEGPSDSRAGFALVQADGSAGPLLAALAGRTGGTPSDTVGRYAPDDPAAQYPPAWRVAPWGADLPQFDPSPVLIHFRGTRFDLTVRRGQYDGIIYVRVDGAPTAALPRDEQGRSYAVLFDPLGQTAELTLARGLADGEHVIELAPDGGWGQWAIAGWSVAREPAPSAAWPVAGAAAGLMLLVLAAIALGPGLAVARADASGALARRLTTALEPYALWLVLGAGALLYLAPNTGAAWLLIAILTVLILWRPREGLALVALAIPYYLQPKTLGIGSYAVVEIVVVQCALSVGLRQARRLWLRSGGVISFDAVLGAARKVRWTLDSLDAVVGLWVLAGALGVVVAENFGVANRELRVVFLEPALYYLLIRLTRVDPWMLVNAFLAGAVLISVQGIEEWVRRVNLITSEGVAQARSVYFSPNNLALYLDRAAPLALALCVFGRSRRWAYALVFGITLVALYLTFVKGAWLLAIPAALLLMGAVRGRRVFAGALLLLALLGASLVPVLGTTRIRSLFDLTTGTSFIRVQLWQSALAMIRDHPLFGVGLDNFLYQYRTRYILPTAFVETGLSHPHNIVLDFWTRLGLVGVALLALQLIVFWRIAYAWYRHAPDERARALALGLMASMLAALVHGLIDNSFFLVDLAFVLMLSLAIVQQAAARARSKPDRSGSVAAAGISFKQS